MSDKVTQLDIFEGYGGRKERLYSYAALAGVFNLIFTVFLLVTKRTGREIPERIDAKDVALLGVATHKLSLLGTQDAVTSPLRAPFTEFQEKESPKSVEEKPRGKGLRRSIGELLRPLPRDVGGLLFHLRSRARAACYPPHSHPFRRRHHLRPPPPDLQSTHEAGLATSARRVQGRSSVLTRRLGVLR